MIDWDRDGDDEIVLFEARDERCGDEQVRRRYQIFVESKRSLVGGSEAKGESAGSIELSSFSLGSESPFDNESQFTPGDLQPQFVLAFGDVNNDGAFDIVFAPKAREGIEMPRGVYAMLNETQKGQPRFGAPVKIALLEPDSIAIADVDQDGYPEIAVNDGGKIKLLFLGSK